MPPHIRIPTVEFRSLLLPPIRIPIRTLQSLVRPRCAHPVPSAAPRVTQCLTQCRSLHLYKTARAKTLLGQHKLLHFSQYKLAPPSRSEHRVNLVKSRKDQTPIAQDISLQDVYDNHMAPGKILLLLQDVPKPIAEKIDKLKEDKWAEKARTYTFMEPHDMIKKGSKDIKVHPQHGHQLGELKNIIVRLSSPLAYFAHCMDRAYQFVAAGSPVEFRIRIKGSVTKAERMKAAPFDNWQWMHDHWPHLRPDFILKSMPPGAMFLIDPVSDGYIVQFVISLKAALMPTTNLNKRLWKVKTGVEYSMRSGKQSQLPEYMRAELVEKGMKQYSVHSGLPRAQALAGYTRDQSVAKWGLEEEEIPRPLRFEVKSKAKGLTFLVKQPYYLQGDPSPPIPREEHHAMIKEREVAEERWLREVKQMNSILPRAGADDYSSSTKKNRKKKVAPGQVWSQELEDTVDKVESLDKEFDSAVADARSAAQNIVGAANDGQRGATTGEEDRRREGHDYKEKKRSAHSGKTPPWHVRGRKK
ncbi:hypothetical protein NX059_001428 [Plenodomus lindquistii]|nr:hypothetical protein NX059_001428 [Plenodomus lindquistii]